MKTLMMAVLSVLIFSCASSEKETSDDEKKKETYVRAYNPQVHQR